MGMASQAPYSQKTGLIAAAAFIVVLVVFILWVQNGSRLGTRLPYTEDLAVKAAASPSGYLTITVSNRFTSPALIIAVTFNGSEVPMPPSNITATGGFTTNANGTYSLPVGASGDFVIVKSELGEVGSGSTYSVDVITVLGNSWPATFTWP
jgi:hypothetical protein